MKTETIIIRVDRETKEAVKAAAAADNRNISNYVQTVLLAALKQEKAA